MASQTRPTKTTSRSSAAFWLSLFFIWVLMFLHPLQARSEDLQTDVFLRSADHVVVEDSPGGTVESYIKLRNTLAENKIPVEIKGMCASACTAFLSVPGVCADRDARFGFHAAYYRPDLEGVEGVRAYFEPKGKYTELLAYYPEPVRKWVLTHGGLRDDLIWLQGAEMRRLVKVCK